VTVICALFEMNRLVPSVECKLLARSFKPLLDVDENSHLVLECCGLVTELGKTSKNVRSMFEEGVLPAVLKQLSSHDPEILVAGARAVNAFTRYFVIYIYLLYTQAKVCI
jgi:hypothetical protein